MVVTTEADLFPPPLFLGSAAIWGRVTFITSPPGERFHCFCFADSRMLLGFPVTTQLGSGRAGVLSGLLGSPARL